MNLNKLLIIANNNVGTGLSGGDRIFLELSRHWQSKFSITVLGSQETLNLLKRYGLNNIPIIKTDTSISGFSPKVTSLIKHQFRRIYFGLITLVRNFKKFSDSNYVYTVSDFYPDLLLGFILKLKYPRIKWIAGYYLLAPNPFSRSSPYRLAHQFLKGLLYYLAQLPSRLIVRNFADFVFVTSQPDIKPFLSQKIKPANIIVIRGGVDVLPSSKYLTSDKVVPLQNRQYDAVFIGRLHPQKGVLELIDIWNLVVQKIPRAKLAMIGDGELETAVKEKINRLHLNKNIDMLGFLDGPKKFSVFKQSKVVLHPATYDSGGMAAAEAMAWGLPGVSFDIEALKTYYPKGMVKTVPGNLETFARNIVRLLKHPRLYARYSVQARNLITSRWDWTRQAENIYSSFVHEP